MVECIQQLILKELSGRTPFMADPFVFESETGVLSAVSCSGPAQLADSKDKVRIEKGTLMSLYKVGAIGACFPEIGESECLMVRIHGRSLDKMLVSTGRIDGSDTKTVPGRLCLRFIPDNPQEVIEKGIIGNHYTFLPTEDSREELSLLESFAGISGIKIKSC